MRRLGFFPSTCAVTTATSAVSAVLEQHQQPVVFPLFNLNLTCSSFFETNNIIVNSSTMMTSSSCSSCFDPTTTTTPAVVNAQRFLRVAKSPMGYHIRRRGQFANHWPLFRKPHNQHPNSGVVLPIFHWRRYSSYDPNQFLPKHNYVTGPWVGLTYSHLHQVYTLQHCNSGVPLKVRRFPTIFEFKSHSRWMIGKQLRNWVEPRAHIFDEAALTKKARLDLVKKGLVPPGG